MPPPATKKPATNPSPARGRVHLPGDDLLERMIVYWGASVVLLVCLLGVLTFLGVSRLRQQNTALCEHAAAIELLHERLIGAESTVEQLRDDLAKARAGQPAKSTTQPAARPSDARQGTRNAESREAPSGASQPAPDASEITALLDKALDPQSPPSLKNRALAEQALTKAQSAEAGESLRGEDWARLAALALLMNREDEAAMHARRAALRGVAPLAHDELVVRRLLAKSKGEEAVAAARKLAENREAGPAARLLLAQACLAQSDFAGADQALSPGVAAGALAFSDRVALGNVLVALERWGDLRQTLEALRDPPSSLQAPINLLRGIDAVQREAHAEALAIFDSLVDTLRGDYDLQVWRGVALLRARQYEASRAALTEAAQTTSRPEAWHWLGALAMETGAMEEAAANLQRALGASRKHAPSWELLGAIALNAGDLASALQDFTNAVDSNPRRAVAYFLLAIVRAKLSQPEETADCLRAALRLDASLLAVARDTPALQKMFTPEQLQALADGENNAPQSAPAMP